MPLKIAILEDNAERRAAMRARVSDRFSQYEVHFFLDAFAMIRWLQTNLSETLVIGLDHDLELTASSGQGLRDPGTGRHVADYLALHTPQCPVVIHSTNSAAVAGMELVLHDAGWVTHRIAPYDDLGWIPEWFSTLRHAIIAAAVPIQASLPLPGASHAPR